MMDQTQDYYDQEYMGALLKGRFPRPGAKLRYRGAHLSMFTNLAANAERELKLGETYTLKMIQLASSWACVTLEETGDTEFQLNFFDDLSQSQSNRNA